MTSSDKLGLDHVVGDPASPTPLLLDRSLHCSVSAVGCFVLNGLRLSQAVPFSRCSLLLCAEWPETQSGCTVQ